MQQIICIFWQLPGRSIFPSEFFIDHVFHVWLQTVIQVYNHCGRDIKLYDSGHKLMSNSSSLKKNWFLGVGYPQTILSIYIFSKIRNSSFSITIIYIPLKDQLVTTTWSSILYLNSGQVWSFLNCKLFLSSSALQYTGKRSKKPQDHNKKINNQD